MIIKRFIFFVFLMTFYSCVDNQNIIENSSNSKDTLLLTKESISDTCLCSFETLKGFYYNQIRYDLIITTSNWNPNDYSCTYSFGELISNEFPPDSIITDFRIHLIDIKKLDFRLDSASFESETIQKQIIATQKLWDGDDFVKCKFDPNHTGKYPKPKQWTNE